MTNDEIKVALDKYCDYTVTDIYNQFKELGATEYASSDYMGEGKSDNRSLWPVKFVWMYPVSVEDLDPDKDYVFDIEKTFKDIHPISEMKVRNVHAANDYCPTCNNGRCFFTDSVTVRLMIRLWFPGCDENSVSAYAEQERFRFNKITPLFTKEGLL